ncbi:TolB amino-terminal domain-containing protein [Muriicola jejuensis]|uniref:Helix-turn-helix domain-containing protein n=1 Tax=Muriicola jejuensis TaxID=504488 RepID=A0A6P0UBX8_9FLAO|nr:helix-turn-helix domain-containing protein [Muriicola jejuensis]NER10000.1 helix-turn-helix domain-containing protein [Muriicola jejuensis]SMP03885.1 TolB amino-terminal domain-containing protein [Muriicola jejuensis]
MAEASTGKSPFIEQARTLVLEHISNENFGVSELAEALHMSRSNLLRKVKKETGLSASRFIRQIRLEEAKELLGDTSKTVSEIAFEVGFGSSSYFIKCFREEYGYPPGESYKNQSESSEDRSTSPKKPYWKWIAAAALLVGIASVVLYRSLTPSKEIDLEKSIAVLPFKNESGDATNVYFINGLMESTLNNLQKIEDFRVVSRTSVEKYRSTAMSVPEIARELHVNYLVEGSGQRIGDQVLLNIKLIEAANDRPIWSEQYSREITDIFALQNEVARKIADAVKAVVTPEEREQIDKRPTENLLAYDYYLQAMNLLYPHTPESLEKAISLFKKAIVEDPEFSLAYANLAIAYYFMDENLKEKQYTEQLNNYADKALLYDSQSAQSLIAKALYYTQVGEYRLALPHLEKALEYNPNSAIVVQILSDFYARVIPNTGKYLEYALKGIQLDIPNDSIAKSYIYLHLSNALIQNGFVEESLEYINKSLSADPNNYYAPLIKAFVLYARNKDLDQLRDDLLEQLEKDPNRLDLLNEMGKIYYFQEEYEKAFEYYKQFAEAREAAGLYIYPQEDLKIGLVYKAMGFDKKAEELFTSYDAYCEADESIYKAASMAMKYVHEGKNEQAIEQLKVFARQDDIQYWLLLFMEEDPLVTPLKSHPEFPGIIQQIEDRFWKHHEQLKKTLKEKGLM